MSSATKSILGNKRIHLFIYFYDMNILPVSVVLFEIILTPFVNKHCLALEVPFFLNMTTRKKLFLGLG